MSFDGWESATLQELTTKIGSGATPRGGKKSYKSEGISLIRSLNVHDREFKTKDLAFIDDAQAALLDNVVLEKDDVLLNITGASVARCCVVPSVHLPARVNQHVSIVRPDQSAILPKFLCYLLTSKEYKDQLLSTGEKQGATRQALTKSLIQNFRVKFPSNLPEQKRIVGILDEAFAAIAQAKENAEKNLANARELFESYLNQVFTQQGPGWQKCYLADVCQSLHQGLNTAGYKVKFFDSGYPIIQTRNIQDGVIDLDTKIKLMCEEDWLVYKDKYRPALGDVFFTNIGTIGKTAIVHIDSDYLIHWNIFKLRPKPEAVTPSFLKYNLDHLTTGGYFKRLQKGGTVDFVTKKMMSEAQVYPPTITEQIMITERLDSLNAETLRLEAIYTQKLANLDELKQSLLQKAFTGQLTAKP